MLVYIHEAGEERDIKIVLPTDLILNPLTAAITAKTVNKKMGGKSANRIKETAEALVEVTNEGSEEEITAAAKDVVVESLSETAVAMNLDVKTINEAFRTLKKFKKAHPDEPLVEVLSDDGDVVRVML